MAISLVSLLDTFLTWMNRTNQTISQINGLANGSTVVANTSISGNLISIVSNNGGIVITGGRPSQSNTVYLDTVPSLRANDTSIANIASSNLVNSVYNQVLTSYTQANTAYNQANNAYVFANTLPATIATAYAAANTASNRANTASDRANTAYGASNTVLITAQAAFARGNTSAQLAFAKVNANSSLMTALSNNDTFTLVPGSGIGLTANTVNNSLIVSTIGTGVVTLTDGATVNLNASLGGVFSLAAGGDRTINIPTNPTDGQKIIIKHKANNAVRTLSLNTNPGGFTFGTDITALTATLNTKSDFIGAIYLSSANTWYVVGYTKGYA